jgi:hypothetical protein
MAQNLPIDQGTGKITYLEVVDATGISNADMLKVAKEWGLKQGYTIKEETADKIVFNGFSNVESWGEWQHDRKRSSNFHRFYFC